MNKIILILLLTIFVCLAVAEERELQEISLDKLMSDYLPEYKIEQQIQLEGEGRDFAVAKESGEIVAVTEIGSNYKVYYFNKESNLKWEKEFFGKGYEINCLISDNGTAIVITSYISEFTTNTVLDNLGNILFKKKLKAIELKPSPDGKFFFEKISMLSNRKKGIYIYDRKGKTIQLSGFDFKDEKNIRLEFLNNKQIISYMDTKFVFFKFDEGYLEQKWSYDLSEKQDFDEFFQKSVVYSSEYIIIKGMIANSNSFVFDYFGNLEYKDKSYQSASFINNKALGKN